MIGSLGWQELLIILVILALIFGATRVADLGGALGRGIREFRSEAGKPEDEKQDDVPASDRVERSEAPRDSSKTG
jgi:sec-independent protein translocase protein TatA